MKKYILHTFVDILSNTAINFVDATYNFVFVFGLFMINNTLNYFVSPQIVVNYIGYSIIGIFVFFLTRESCVFCFENITLINTVRYIRQLS